MSKKLKTKIIVIEDEEGVAQQIKSSLIDNDYDVAVLGDGLCAVETIEKNNPDLVLLDWLLPGKSGIDICKEIRKSKRVNALPVIMISARGSDFEKVIGLDSGADDYLSKPFSSQELIARVRALLRRAAPLTKEGLLAYKGIEMDTARHKTSKNNVEIKLAPIEFQILQILLENSEKVVSRDMLMSKIWGMETYVEERTIDVHITRLRKALVRADKNDSVEIIKTIRSVGYKLELPH
ncbi:response regulator [Candidatus Bandiella euplotis]|uniref:DNA-binding response regulator n=1 Tax=Candidatus Bandiella euplotis TaxID=1664265 RepID=A0ABZ0UL11_9RICK|nr:response regulator [Candidatus Bandiella woodruffii]WPX95941.1 DNA-binding response regulator [Candidatus Bandiella woodruffii]